MRDLAILAISWAVFTLLACRVDSDVDGDSDGDVDCYEPGEDLHEAIEDVEYGVDHGACDGYWCVFMWTETHCRIAFLTTTGRIVSPALVICGGEEVADWIESEYDCGPDPYAWPEVAF